LRKRFKIGTGFKRSRVQPACRRARCHQMAAAEAGAGEVIHARHAGSVRARSACFINTLSGYCSATSDCGVIGDRLFRMWECCSNDETCCRAWIGPRRAKQLQPQCNPLRPSGARRPRSSAVGRLLAAAASSCVAAVPRSSRAMTFYDVAMFQGPSKPLPGPSRIPKHSECPIWTSETGALRCQGDHIAVPGPMSLGLLGGPGQASPRKKPSEFQLQIICGVEPRKSR
jgi:hypothetical protein